MIIIYFICPKSGMSFTRKRLTRQFVMLLELTAYTGWVSGTLAGFVLGTFLFFRNARIPARLDAFLKFRTFGCKSNVNLKYVLSFNSPRRSRRRKSLSP